MSKFRCIKLNKNKLILSVKIKEFTGWKRSICTTEELYNWIILKYGKNIDLNSEVGQLLRTMKPNYYFMMINYVNELICI